MLHVLVTELVPGSRLNANSLQRSDASKNTENKHSLHNTSKQVSQTSSYCALLYLCHISLEVDCCQVLLL